MGRKPTDDSKVTPLTDKKMLIKLFKKAHIGHSIYHGVGGTSSIEIEGLCAEKILSIDFDRDGNLMRFQLQDIEVK